MTGEAAATGADQSVRARVEKAMERIRPAVQSDGGDVQVVEIDEAEGIVRVAMTGACQGCAMSGMTLTLGVERTIRELVPEIKAVEAVDPDDPAL